MRHGGEPPRPVEGVHWGSLNGFGVQKSLGFCMILLQFQLEILKKKEDLKTGIKKDEKGL